MAQPDQSIDDLLVEVERQILMSYLHLCDARG